MKRVIEGELGGEAVANYQSVADYESANKIVETAINEFGREKVSGTTHGQIISFCSCMVPDTI